MEGIVIEVVGCAAQRDVKLSQASAPGRKCFFDRVEVCTTDCRVGVILPVFREPTLLECGDELREGEFDEAVVVDHYPVTNL